MPSCSETRTALENIFGEQELSAYVFALAHRETPLPPSRIRLQPVNLSSVLARELTNRTGKDPQKRERACWLYTDGKALQHGEIYVIGQDGGAPLKEETPSGFLGMGVAHSHSENALPSPDDVFALLDQASPLSLELIAGPEATALILATPQTRRFNAETLTKMLISWQQVEKQVFATIVRSHSFENAQDLAGLQWQSADFLCRIFGLLLFRV